MASWWRLRTQISLVMAVLLFLIAFLGIYALKEAQNHAADVDELLSTNFKAVTLVNDIEAAAANESQAVAKYGVTHDVIYKEIAEKQGIEIQQRVHILYSLLARNHLLGQLAQDVERVRLEGGSFLSNLYKLERMLEVHRSQKTERIRAAARDLRKIILVALLIAMVVTGWLAIMFYVAVFKPLQRLKFAAQRIREGELSHRVEPFIGFEELAALREEFNAMAVKLEELDRTKNEFLSTISHELKTPLTALKEGLLFLNEKQGSLPAAVIARTNEVCLQAAKRLEMMIQNLLNHAKMESGFYSFDERPKSFITVIESAIQGIRLIAERRGVLIKLRVHTNQCQASFSTEGITHVMENLLLNAIKYGDSSHPVVIDVLRRESRPVPQLEVRVTNHGRGLLPHELSLVFGRFFRALNSEGQAGVGIGLNVVKRIIEAHHGTVAAASEEGVTTFSFLIPQQYESRSVPVIYAGANA